MGIKHPDLFAGGWVESEHTIKRGAVIEQTVRLDRYGLQRGAARILFEIPLAMNPGHFQICDVFRGDLVQRRILTAAGVIPKGGPIIACLSLRHRSHAKHGTDTQYKRLHNQLQCGLPATGAQ